MSHVAAPIRHRTDRIDLTEDGEVAYWTETLGVSEEELRRTVAEVGDAVEAVCDRHPM